MMVAIEGRRALGRGDGNQRLIVILAVLFLALIALGALWGDISETWMNGTAL